MLHCKPCNKNPDDCIDVFRTNKHCNEIVGSFWLERDKSWTFDPNSITSAELREIADKLDELNGLNKLETK